MLITKNIIVNPTLLPIIGESNKLTQELSKRFAKYYRRGIKKENRNKLLGYSLLIPKALSKLKSSFREDLMMIEVKVNKKSSILIPSYYTKAKTLRELFILENRKQLKSIYKVSNGKYKIDLKTISEATGSLGGVSIAQASGKEINLGHATDVTESSINKWLEAELGETAVKRIVKGMNKGLHIIPGGGHIVKGLDAAIDKIMSKGQFDKWEGDLTVDSFSDGAGRAGAMLVELFKNSEGDENKSKFIQHATTIFNEDSINQSTVVSWAQKLMDIDANNLLQIETKLNKLLLKDMKKFILISDGAIKGRGTKSFFFTIDKFKKKAHDEVDKIFEKYSIKADQLAEVANIEVIGRIKQFWRGAAKMLATLLFVCALSGISPGRGLIEPFFVSAERIFTSYFAQGTPLESTDDIVKHSQVADSDSEIRSSRSASNIPIVKRCIETLDQSASNYSNVTNWVEKNKEIAPDDMHDIFVVAITDELNKNPSNNSFAKLKEALIVSQGGPGVLSKINENLEAARNNIKKSGHENSFKDFVSSNLHEHLLDINQNILDYNKDNPSNPLLKDMNGLSVEFQGLLKIYGGIAINSKLGASAGFRSSAVAAHTIVDVIGLSENIPTNTVNEITSLYKEALKLAQQNVNKVTNECIADLKAKGKLDSPKDAAKLAADNIEVAVAESMGTFRGWIEKQLSVSGDSVVLKAYDDLMKWIYLKAYKALLEEDVTSKSKSVDNAVKGTINDPKALNRLSSIIMLGLLGIHHKWTRKDEIGTIGADIMRQGKQKNRIFKSLYVMNAIKVAQTIAYCSTMKALKEKTNPKLVEKMGILNNELSCLVSVFEGDAHTGRFVIKYSSKSPSGSSNQLDGLLDDNDRSEGHLDPDAIKFDPSHFVSQGES
jgi:hypothetical protein